MTTLNHHPPRLPAALGAPTATRTTHTAETAEPQPITRPNDPPTAVPAALDTPAQGAEGAPRETLRPAERNASRGDARGRELTSSEFTAVAVVAALVAVLGLLGFVNSFTAVADEARPSFGRLAWTVPLGIDLGIAIFAALDIVLARIDMRIRWLRFIPWGLTAATIYLNVDGEHTMFGKVAHAVLPALWVVAVEIAAHVIRIRAGIVAGTRMEGIRASRWFLAPWPTVKLWRRMVLWEIRSYREALDRERARVLALTGLQDTYGRWGWRRRAPRRVRALYRLGELTDAALTGDPAATAPDSTSATAPDSTSATAPDSTSATAPDSTSATAPDSTSATAPDSASATAPDSASATAPDSASDGAPVGTAATSATRPATRARHASGRKSATRGAAKSAAKSAVRADRMADKARALLADDPAMSGAELGRRLKVSERTGLRYRAQVLAQTTPADPADVSADAEGDTRS